MPQRAPVFVRSLLSLAAIWVGTLGLPASRAFAAEIRILATVATTPAFRELIPAFEAATGHTVRVDFGLTADLRTRVASGEAVDLIVLTRPAMADLERAGVVRSGTLTDIAGTDVALVIRTGAPRPDIGTVESFRTTLLAARSISYADPAKGGVSGVVFDRVLERMGLRERIGATAVLVPGNQAADVVARGDAELGVSHVAEAVPVAGIDVVGPFPGEFAFRTIITTGLAARAAAPDAAAEFVRFLQGQAATAVLVRRGFVRQ